MVAAQGELYIIDVSQSVDLEHPHALHFLREDIAHINAFFRRAGVATLTTRELFDFVVDPSINDGNIEAAMEHLRELAGRCAAGAAQLPRSVGNVSRHKISESAN